ncbi:MAG: hypothetical protein HC819_07295 [Cyclobacteriaceae bacterium]|nr:hypothetical protein [Cyclobacteriaceae bacterium]
MKTGILFYFLLLSTIASAKTFHPDSLQSEAHRVHRDNRVEFDRHNLIQNFGFEENTRQWILGKYNGGMGVFLADSIAPIAGNSSAIVVSSNQGKELQDLKLFTAVDLPVQEHYSLTFSASVKKACLISVSIDNGVTALIEEKLLLRPGVELYGPFTFCNDYNEPFLFLAFNLGKTSQKIKIDNVGLYLQLPDATPMLSLKNEGASSQIASLEMSTQYREVDGAFPK